MRISDWSSDVCSSDLVRTADIGQLIDLDHHVHATGRIRHFRERDAVVAARRGVQKVDADVRRVRTRLEIEHVGQTEAERLVKQLQRRLERNRRQYGVAHALRRSEEHTSELQSLMRISYAVFCLKKKKT